MRSPAFAAAKAANPDPPRRLAVAPVKKIAPLPRGSIRRAKDDLQLQEKFDGELRFVLATERLELGRRDGGRIACPLAIGDWPWVYDKYHAHLLPQRHLMVGTRRVPLPDNEALALYVTRRSLSNPLYVFTISVHHWLRIEGSTEPPGLPGPQVAGSFMPMNAEHWFDTVYLPIVTAARDRRLLRDFPDRTEADIYLWVIANRERIEEAFDGGAPVDPDRMTEAYRSIEGRRNRIRRLLKRGRRAIGSDGA